MFPPPADLTAADGGAGALHVCRAIASQEVSPNYLIGESPLFTLAPDLPVQFRDVRSFLFGGKFWTHSENDF